MSTSQSYLHCGRRYDREMVKHFVHKQCLVWGLDGIIFPAVDMIEALYEGIFG